MSDFWKGLGILLVFLGLPLGLLHLADRRAAEEEEERLQRQLIEGGRRELETQVRQSTTEGQIAILMKRFNRRAETILKRLPPHRWPGALAKAHQALLARNLPQHDLLIGWIEPFRQKLQPLFFHDGGLGFVPQVATDLVKWLHFQGTEIGTNLHLPARLSNLLRAKVSNQFVSPVNRGQVSPFLSLEGSRGLFWDLVPYDFSTSTDLQGVVTAILEMEHTGGDFGLRLQTRTWRDARTGLGFFPLDGNRLHLSAFFRRQPELVGFLQQAVREGRSLPSVSRVRGCLLLAIPLDGEASHQGMLAIPLPHPPMGASPGGNVFWLASVWAIAAGLLLTAEKTLFHRGPRISVGLTLTGSFLLIALLPLSVVTVVFQQATAEDGQRRASQEELSLREDLTRVDEQTRLMQIEFQYLLQRMFTDAFGRIASTPTEALEKLPELLVEEIPRLVPSLRRVPLNAALLTNTKGWAGTWIRIIEDEVRGGNNALLTRMLIPMSHQLQAQREKGRPERPGEPPPTKTTPTRNEFAFEVIRDAFMGMRAGDLFLRQIHFPRLTTMIRSDIGRLHFLFVPSATPILGTHWQWGLFWDEFAIDQGFLPEVLESMARSASNTLLMGLRRAGMVPQIVPPGALHHPDLLELARRSQAVSRPLRQERPGDPDRPLLIAQPSAYLSQTILAGRRSTAHLEAERTDRRRRFLFGMGGAIAIALLLAWMGAGTFTAPLRRILEGMGRIRSGDFSGQSTDDHRPDEFGLLAQAFNGMTRGLRERKILGRYVSATVRQMAETGIMHQQGVGQLGEATILFSGLYQFETFQQTASAEEAFSRLERHLARMNDAVHRFGGEINKIIGDKILVVFEHDRLGGKTQAARAAVAVGLAMMEGGEPGDQGAAIGITSGPVIAGLLGSPDFRLDFTVIGDTVNLASRLATLAQVIEAPRIVLAAEVTELLDGSVRIEKLPFRRIKGKTREVVAYRVRGEPT